LAFAEYVRQIDLEIARGVDAYPKVAVECLSLLYFRPHRQLIPPDQ